jgi:hypothetical protein
MTTQTMEDPGERDLRRLQLAKRLVSHEARTRTIYRFTGYSRHRLATLRRRWGVSKDSRHRGPAPTSFSVFFRSPRMRSEGAVAAAICQMFGAVVTRQYDRFPRDFTDLESGERLCEVYEAFHACFPGSGLDFDQLMLLAMGLSKKQVVGIGTCASCNCAILIDLLSKFQRTCPVCQRRALSIVEFESNAGDQTTETGDAADPGETQGKLF